MKPVISYANLEFASFFDGVEHRGYHACDGLDLRGVDIKDKRDYSLWIEAYIRIVRDEGESGELRGLNVPFLFRYRSAPCVARLAFGQLTPLFVEKFFLTAEWDPTLISASLCKVLAEATASTEAAVWGRISRFADQLG